MASINEPNDGVPPFTLRDFMLKGNLLDDPVALSATMRDADSWLDPYTSALLAEIITHPEGFNEYNPEDVSACISNLLNVFDDTVSEEGFRSYSYSFAEQVFKLIIADGLTGELWEMCSDDVRSAAIVRASLF